MRKLIRTFLLLFILIASLVCRQIIIQLGLTRHGGNLRTYWGACWVAATRA